MNSSGFEGDWFEGDRIVSWTWQGAEIEKAVFIPALLEKSQR
ncbi:hypothetical protein [Lentzea sp. NBRC 105346]|nr:hypothetical protein [Lentzea sp. NBRC 105346]